MLMVAIWYSGIVTGQVLVPLEGLTGDLRDVYDDGNTLWYATTAGLFYSQDNLSATSFKEQPFTCIRKVRKEVLLCGTTGVSKLKNGKLEPLSLGDIDQRQVAAIIQDPQNQETVYFGTDRGVYVQDHEGGSTRLVLTESSPVHGVFLTGFLEVMDNGTVWTALYQNLYQKDGSIFQPRGQAMELVDPVLVDGQYFFRTYSGKKKSLWSYEPNGPLEELEPQSVLDLAAVDKKLWLSLNGQVFVLNEEGFATQIDSINKSIDDIRFIGRMDYDVVSKEDKKKKNQSFHWFASPNMISYCQDCSHPDYDVKDLVYKYDAFSVKSAFQRYGDILLWGTKGAYRIYTNVKIQMSTNLIDDGKGDGLTLAEKTVRLNHVSYDIPEGTLFPKERAGVFTAYIWSDRDAFETEKHCIAQKVANVQENCPKKIFYTDWTKAKLNVSSGHTDVFIAVRDVNGNMHYEEYANVRLVEKKRNFEENIRFWGSIVAFILLVGPPAVLGLLFGLSGCSWIPAEVRRYLFLFCSNFGAGRVYFINPTWPFIRRRFYDIHHGIQCRDVPTACVTCQIIVQELQKSVNSHQYTHYPNEGAVKVEDISKKILCGTGFKHVFPVTLFCENMPSEVTVKDIEDHVISRLQTEYRSSNRVFFERLLVHGNFAFLFSVQSAGKNNPIAKAIRTFFKERSSGSYLLLLPKSGVRSTSSTSSQAGSKKRRAK